MKVIRDEEEERLIERYGSVLQKSLKVERIFIDDLSTPSCELILIIIHI